MTRIDKITAFLSNHDNLVFFFIIVACAVYAITTGVPILDGQPSNESDPYNSTVDSPYSGYQFHSNDPGHFYLIATNDSVSSVKKVSKENITEAELNNSIIIFNSTRASKLAVAETNEFRREHNKSTLEPQPVLQSTARAKSNHMLQNEYFGHDPPGETTQSEQLVDPVPNDAFEETTPPVDGIGENIHRLPYAVRIIGNSEPTATYIVGEPSTGNNLTKRVVEESIKGFAQSPRHRENLLGDYESVGVGYTATINQSLSTDEWVVIEIYGTHHYGSKE